MHLFSLIIVNTHGNKHIFIVIVITVSIKSLRICWGHEYDHTFYRVTPHMCTICGMRNRYLRCLFLIDFVIIRKRVPQMAELPSSACIALGWGLLSQYSPFRYFPIFSEWSKQWLPVWHQVHIWQVSPQLSCGDTWQIWTWLKLSDLYFC